MQYAAPHVALMILSYFSLTPALLLHGWIWQLATYSFLNAGRAACCLQHAYAVVHRLIS